MNSKGSRKQKLLLCCFEWLSSLSWELDANQYQDGFKAANAWVNNGITWLDEIQQFYRERAAIEKEYGAKLDALAKKYFEKKNKKISPLSVGDNPTLTPGSLER